MTQARLEPRWAFRIRARLGRRGVLLLTLATMDFAYGVALFVTPPAVAHWWPASAGELYGIPTYTWGILWMGVGVFMLFGLDRNWPDWPQFSAATALFAWWGFTAFVYSTTQPSPGTWGIGATYTGLALIVLVAAGWEEPPE